MNCLGTEKTKGTKNKTFYVVITKKIVRIFIKSFLPD